MYIRRIHEYAPEVPGAGRLGRHVRHDPRSLRYLVAEQDPATLTSVRHARHIPVLDQGDLGSCTGNAALGAVGTAGLFEALAGSALQPSTTDEAGDEQLAVSLYSNATTLDDYPGTYPPDDTGSDGLSVAKACVQAGLISGYRHATSLEAALTALASQAVITGVDWMSSFDEPDDNGLIKISKRSYIRGGHEFVVDEIDVERQMVGFTNSWGTGWGLNGRAYLSWADWGWLLDNDGDVTVFTPLTEPAPTPAPDPDEELAGCLATLLPVAQRWLANRKGKS